MIKKIFKSGSMEWLNTRTNYITGTEVSALLGLNKYQSPAKVLKDKIEPPAKIDNMWMRAGRILEPGVFIAVSEVGIASKPVSDGNVVMFIDEETRLSASLDGICSIKSKKYYLEAKTTGSDKFELWGDGPPINYLLQVQVQLHVTQSDVMLLACLESNFPFRLTIFRVEKSPEVIEIIKSECIRFWKCYAEGKTFVVNKALKDKTTMLLNKVYKKIY